MFLDSWGRFNIFFNRTNINKARLIILLKNILKKINTFIKNNARLANVFHISIKLRVTLFKWSMSSKR